MDRRRVSLGLVWIALAAAWLFADARAAAVTQPLPPQPLAEALETLAETTGYQLVYRAELAAALRTEGAAAGLSVTETLRRLLQGTGLVFAFINDRTIAIYKPRADQNDMFDRASPADGRTKLKNSSFISRFITFLGAALAGTSTFVVQAQNGESAALEEIIVTAERRTADVQDVGASIAVRSGDELAREGKTTLDQIIGDIAGISGTAFPGEAGATAAFSNDSPITGVAIRGVRSNSGAIGLPNNATTAMYVDGVYGGVGGTYDIDRVEVLRGPQGTLYGRSATGGVIAFYTRDPNTQEFGGDASVEVGSYDLRRAGGAVNFPVVTDKFAVRVSANEYRKDGYDYDYSSGYTSRLDDARVKALYTPTENLSVLLGVALQNVTTYVGATRYVATSPDSWVLEVRPQFEGKGVNKHRQYWSKVAWNLGAATLTYQPSLRTFEKNQISYAPTVGGNQRERVSYPDDTFVTHELQLTSNPGSKFDWQVGAIYYKNEADYFADYYRIESGAFSLQRDLNRDTTQYGMYGEATFPLTDRTRITAGLRHDKTEVAMDGELLYNSNRNLNSTTPTAGFPVILQLFTVSGKAGTRNFDNTTYKLRLEQDLTDQAMVYTMVSSAFVPGDVAITSATPVSAYSFKAETLTSYELGLKSRFFDNRLQVNGAVYYYDYGGRQVNTEVIPGDPTTTVTLVTPAKITGAELETLYQLTDADRIGLEVGVIDAKYTHISAAWRAQFAYEDIGNISPLTVKLSYDHDFMLPNSSKLRFGADARYTGSYLNGDVTASQIAVTDYYRVDSYIIGNVNLDWSSPSGRYGVGSYVRNISDKRYKQQSMTTVVGLSDPRTYGLSLRAKF